MTFSAVLFDLDGTLLNTLEDLAVAANSVLVENGFPTHPVDAYRTFVGDGVTRLFERALPPNARQAEVVETCAAAFREAYGKGWDIHTKPYDGISDLLQYLSGRLVKTGVLSNKPDDFTQRCVQKHLAGSRMDVVLGQRSGQPAKPDPSGALALCDQLGLAAREVVFVGDSNVDMRTAVAAGMLPVGVLWGFRTREELLTGGARILIRYAMELVELLPFADA